MKTAGVVIAIGGGKGGVGKSLIAANLAVALAQTGRRTVLVDGDLGSPNLHTVLGLEKVPRTLESLFRHEVEHLEQARLPTPIDGLSLVAGSAAAPGSANIPHSQKQKLLRHILQLDAQAVVVDVGAGTSFNTLDLFNVADVRLVVTTPQLTALQNAYAFGKSAVFRELRSLAVGKQQLELLEDPRLQRETARMKQLVQHVRKQDPTFAEALTELLELRRLHVLGNCMLQDRDANVFHAFARMVKDFLAVDCEVVGQLKSSRRAHDSINRRRPLLADEEGSDFALAFKRLADRFGCLDVASSRKRRATVEARAAQAHQEVAPEPLPADLEAYSRTAARNEPAIDARLDGRPVKLQDLTDDGALIRCERELKSGQRLSLETPDGKRRAVEIRSKPDPGVYGARFISEEAA